GVDGKSDAKNPLWALQVDTAFAKQLARALESGRGTNTKADLLTMREILFGKYDSQGNQLEPGFLGLNADGKPGNKARGSFEFQMNGRDVARDSHGRARLTADRDLVGHSRPHWTGDLPYSLTHIDPATAIDTGRTASLQELQNFARDLNKLYRDGKIPKEVYEYWSAKQGNRTRLEWSIEFMKTEQNLKNEVSDVVRAAAQAKALGNNTPGKPPQIGVTNSGDVSYISVKFDANTTVSGQYVQEIQFHKDGRVIASTGGKEVYLGRVTDLAAAASRGANTSAQGRINEIAKLMESLKNIDKLRSATDAQQFVRSNRALALVAEALADPGKALKDSQQANTTSKGLDAFRSDPEFPTKPKHIADFEKAALFMHLNKVDLHSIDRIRDYKNMLTNSQISTEAGVDLSKNPAAAREIQQLVEQSRTAGNEITLAEAARIWKSRQK
ncbi:MAG: hypothetical protein K2Z81_19655, partial [Cyanobacteria bacterium]|nr:hypothetical protein [Cyanobacteriota bacterium]